MRFARRSTVAGLIVLVALAGGTLVSPPESEAAQAAAISAGALHTCILTDAGGVKCWGDNAYGQLGDGTAVSSRTPVDVVGLEGGVAAVAAQGIHTCALTDAGTVKCWGHNGGGRLGNGTGVARWTAVDVCADAACTEPLSGIASIAPGGGFHTCVVMEDGGVKCWGLNNNGALGDGTGADSDTPVDVLEAPGGPPLTGVVAAVSGSLYTCALKGSGDVVCWGRNGHGQLGDGTFSDRPTPVQVSGLADVALLGGGGGHVCARSAAGGAMCWGTNIEGELGDGTTVDRSTPVPVIGLGSGVVLLSHGVAGHTCAVMDGGGLKCWGFNFAGQVDRNSGVVNAPNVTSPIDVPGLDHGVADVATGIFHTCALMTAGNVTCWGSDHYGQLGDADSDGLVDAIDAALVLQYDARLITSLANEESADVNRDGEATSEDATLILQHTAGLIELGP
jgi:alpha-tubulin suppressor-like RCC1 family protein